MKATVNKAQRSAKMRAHTATHLLHFMLGSLLGTTKQAGSLVDDDYLRFDFATKKALSDQQLHDIETRINHIIMEALPVNTEEMSYDKAIQTGAKAFFEDKYGDTVRVVSIKAPLTRARPELVEGGGAERSEAEGFDITSVELCGGTHVPNTADIGAFKITGQESVASGIRRIIAVTGPKVAFFAQDLENAQFCLANKLDCQPKQLEEKIDKILKAFDHIKADHESLQSQIVAAHLEELQLQCQLPGAGAKWGEGCIINTTGTPLEHHSFKEVVNQAKTKRSDRNRIIYNHEGNFAIYMGKEGFSAKEFATEHKLKGGGSDQLVQGRDGNIGKLFS